MGQRIILAGGGHAHLSVLADWAKLPPAQTERWLLTSSRYTAYSGMLPGWLAGNYRSADLMIDLDPQARYAGVHLVIADIIGLDADAKTIQLSSGVQMGFDLASLATGGEANVTSLLALGDKLLPVKPVDSFVAKWSAFVERSQLRGTARVIVVGGGAAGVEMAIGVDAALRRLSVHAIVSLVSPPGSFLAGHAEKARHLAMDALGRRGIAVHFAQATGTEDGLTLSTGIFLRADCVVAATGSRAQPWLAQSGLACTDKGFVQVGADLRSVSHPAILAAGDVIQRVDRQLERSGVHAVKAGPVLAANIRASIDGSSDHLYNPRRHTLYLLAHGNRQAILSWGPVVTAGKWVWRLKDWIDRSFVRRYQAIQPLSERDPS